MSLPDTFLPALARAAAAAAGSLPATTPLSAGQPVADPSTGVIPGDGARAISARLNGDLSGSVAILVSAAAAEALENGPVAQDLAAALEPALAAVVSELSSGVEGDLRFEAAQSLDAEVAIGAASAAEDFIAIPLLNEEGHAATVVVIIEPATQASSVEFGDLTPIASALAGPRSLELLSDVEMGLSVELGRTRMSMSELLSLTPGAVVELDRAAGSPVDVLVNGTLIAKGEVVVIDEEFGVRITEIVGHDHKNVRSA